VRFEVLPHTADTAILAYGATLNELLENAAYGMFSLMFDLTEVDSSVSRPIVAIGDTAEELLVGWLSELLTTSEIHDLAFSFFTVDRVEQGGVQGSAGGMSSVDRALIGPPIKAVTWHDLAVVENPDVWWARMVFDV
jgi:SHS2 domain-containing protein